MWESTMWASSMLRHVAFDGLRLPLMRPQLFSGLGRSMTAT